MRKRLLYLAVLSMAVMVVFAPAAMAQDRLNCVEVSTGDAETIQEEAQALLNENPNGPAQNLDANGNGIACEYTTSVASGTQFEDGSGFISGAGAAPSAGGQGTQPQANTACSELVSGDAEATQQQAQALLNDNPSDPNNFDANGNGVACEYATPTQGSAVFEDGSRFSIGAQAAPASGGSGSQYNDGGSTSGDGDTGGTISGGTLPDTGGASLFVLAGGALLVGGGLLARRIVR